MYLTPAWQKVKEENEANEMAEKMRLEREDNLWRERMKKEAEAAKVQAEEPKPEVIPQGPERQIARSGEHFITMRSSLDGDAPQIYFVKKVGNKESVPFQVLNGNSFAALQSAFNLFETRVEKIGSTKPADIK